MVIFTIFNLKYHLNKTYGQKNEMHRFVLNTVLLKFHQCLAEVSFLSAYVNEIVDEENDALPGFLPE